MSSEDKTLKNLLILIIFGFLSISLLPAGYCDDTISQILENSTPNANSQGNSNSFDHSIIESNMNSMDSYVIQVGIFSNTDNADKEIIELKQNGFDPYIYQTINSKGQTLYSVRIGTFKSFSEASEQLERISGKLRQAAMITKYNSLEPASGTGTTSVVPSDNAVTKAAASNKVPVSKAQADETIDETHGTVTLEKLQEKMISLQNEVEQLKGEAEVRQKLTVSEEEAKRTEENILQGAGGQYTLTQQGNIKFSYGLSYVYDRYDAVRASTRIEDVATHTITNSIEAEYGLKDNFSASTTIPFVYSYYKVGTIQEETVTDFGDLGLNWKVQPLKSTKNYPTIIAFGGFSVPIGRNPYEIQYGEELSTSSGIYSTNVGVSVSQTSDPVVVFGSLNLNYPFGTQDINQKRPEGTLIEVDPGIGIGASVGMAYALSYKLSLNTSFGYSYAFSTDYRYLNAPAAESGDSTSASMNIGAGYSFTRKSNLYFTVGIPLTTPGSFSISFSTPIQFQL